jgi:hypothetical protein
MPLKAIAMLLLVVLQVTNQQHLKAQTTITIGPSIAAGTNTFPENGRLGLGFTLQCLRALHPNGSLVTSTSYMWFNQRFPGVDSRTVLDSIPKIGLNGYDISFIPFTVGYKRFVFRQAAFLSAELGAGIIGTREDPEDLISYCSFLYAIGSGYRFKFANGRFADLSFQYTANRIDKNVHRNYFKFSTTYALWASKKNL